MPILAPAFLNLDNLLFFPLSHYKHANTFWCLMAQTINKSIKYGATVLAFQIRTMLSDIRQQTRASHNYCKTVSCRYQLKPEGPWDQPTGTQPLPLSAKPTKRPWTQSQIQYIFSYPLFVFTLVNKYSMFYNPGPSWRIHSSDMRLIY